MKFGLNMLTCMTALQVPCARFCVAQGPAGYLQLDDNSDLIGWAMDIYGHLPVLTGRTGCRNVSNLCLPDLTHMALSPMLHKHFEQGDCYCINSAAGILFERLLS